MTKFLETSDICPSCNEDELRPVQIGNDKDGWTLTGDFECDNCGRTFQTANNTDELEEVGEDVYPEDDYVNYQREEIHELNTKL